MYELIVTPLAFFTLDLGDSLSNDFRNWYSEPTRRFIDLMCFNSHVGMSKVFAGGIQDRYAKTTYMHTYIHAYIHTYVAR
jgi:hypothetical protein